MMGRAQRLEGPRSDAKKIYHSPEGNRPHVLTYGVKAHGELKGADLIITCGINGSDEADADGAASMNFPRFAQMNWVDR